MTRSGLALLCRWGADGFVEPTASRGVKPVWAHFHRTVRALPAMALTKLMDVPEN